MRYRTIALERDPDIDRATELGLRRDTDETHAPAVLTGGSVPSHVAGAYPSLECCGGPIQLMSELEARALWGDR